MGKHFSTYIIIYVIIITTLLNIFFINNKKLMNNPKLKKVFGISLVLGILIFIIVLVADLQFSNN